MDRMGSRLAALGARVRRTEVATLVTIVAVLLGAALGEHDRASLIVAAALLGAYDVIWFHIVPEHAFGDRHFAIGVLATQAIAVVLLAMTGGAGSTYFPIYVLGVLASGLRPGTRTSAVVGGFALAAFLALAAAGALTGADTPADLLASRTIGLAMSAAFVVMIARALERSQSEILAGRKLLEDIIEAVHTAVVSMDQEGRVVRWNPEAERTFGWREEEILGRTVADTLVPPRYRADHSRGLQAFLRSGEGPLLGRRMELEALHADGSELPIEITIAAVPAPGGWSFTALITDISARRRRLRELEEQATQDALTGLANRRQLYARLEQVVELAARERSTLAVVLMDLDKFKEVNDTYGHEVGDDLLRAFGRSVAAQLRDSDTVARLGGDEFACVLPGADLAAAEVVAAKIVNASSRPYALRGRAIAAHPSIGLAAYPRDGADAPALLHAADVAMYIAKRRGGGVATHSGGGGTAADPAPTVPQRRR